MPHVPCLAALVALTACGGAFAGIGSPARAAHRIAEQVLLHAMASEEMGIAAAGADVVCVALGSVGRRADPDSSFLARFKAREPMVLPWSACALDTQRADRLVHVPTGRAAIGYTIEWPRQVSARRVVVAIAYYTGALDAAGYVCEVALREAEWRVDSCKRRWIA